MPGSGEHQEEEGGDVLDHGDECDRVDVIVVHQVEAIRSAQLVGHQALELRTRHLVSFTVITQPEVVTNLKQGARVESIDHGRETKMTKVAHLLLILSVTSGDHRPGNDHQAHEDNMGEPDNVEDDVPIEWHILLEVYQIGEIRDQDVED